MGSVLKKEPANIIDKDGTQAASIEEDGTAVNIQKSAKQKRGKNKGGQQRSFPELLEETQGQKVGKEQSEQVGNVKSEKAGKEQSEKVGKELEKVGKVQSEKVAKEKLE